MDRGEGPTWVEIVADRKIREAMEEGKFDNLPGKGRRLDLEAYSLVPPEMRAAYCLMREANLAPDWIELSGAIRRRHAEWEERRQAFLERRARFPAPDPGRDRPACERQDRLRDNFLREMALALIELNRMIDSLNLIVPTPGQGRLRLAVREIMQSLEVELPRILPRAEEGPSAWEHLIRPSGKIRHGNKLPARRTRDP